MRHNTQILFFAMRILDGLKFDGDGVNLLYFNFDIFTFLPLVFCRREINLSVLICFSEQLARENY